MANSRSQTFIDGVGEVRVRDGIVRMDLLAQSPTRRDDNGNPVPGFVDQLVMSPHAFLRMTVALNGTLKQMREQGELGTEGGGEAAAAEPKKADKPKAKPAAKKKRKSKPASPNF